MNKIVILFVDDWAVVYLNGKSVYQTHTITPSHLESLCPIESMEIKEADEKLYEMVKFWGEFPPTLEEALRMEEDERHE
jgi:hypothetical protein